MIFWIQFPLHNWNLATTEVYYTLLLTLKTSPSHCATPCRLHANGSTAVESSSNARAAVLSQTLVYRCDRIDGYLPSGMLYLARSIPSTATQFAFRAESIMCADFLVECTCLSKFSIWRWIDANLDFKIAKEQQIWTLYSNRWLKTIHSGN